MSANSSTQKHPDCLHDLKHYSTLLIDVIITFQRKVYKLKVLKEFIRRETIEYRFLLCGRGKPRVLKRTRFRFKMFTYHHICETFGTLDALGRVEMDLKCKILRSDKLFSRVSKTFSERYHST